MTIRPRERPRKNPKVDSKAMTFTFDVETWFKDSVHLFPTSTIVYNIRKILIYYSKQRCDMTFIFYLKRVFKITAYTLPKGNMCANYQVCAILERIYGLGKDFTISIDLSISQTQNCGSRSMHILRSISRVWTMDENTMYMLWTNNIQRSVRRTDCQTDYNKTIRQ